MTLFAAIGNTTIKLADNAGAPQTIAAAASAADIASAVGRLAPEAVVAESVNPAASRRLREACSSAGLPEPLFAGEDFPHNVELAAEVSGSPGIDRLLNVKAAFTAAKRPCIAVDLGTAISISAADAGGRFAGGAIGAGLSLSLRALCEGTAFLRQVEVARPVQALGRDTTEAMLSGVVFGALGAVKEIVSRIEGELGAKPAVFITGGDARLFAEFAPDAWEVSENLTLDGLRLAYEESRK